MVVDDLFSRISSIYFQFISRLSYDEIISHAWSDWIPTILTLPFYFIFLKLVQFDVNSFKIGVRSNNLSRVINIFNITLAVYYILEYILTGLPSLENEGWIITNLDDIYYRRLILFIYLPIFLGFLLYISYVAKKNINDEIQKMKDEQITSLSIYNNHIEGLYKEIRGFRHDYTNLLSSLNQAIQNKDIVGIEKIYNSVFRDSDKRFQSSQYDIGNLSNLDNDALKSLVSVKMIEAQNKGINLSVEVEEPIDIPNSLELIDVLKIVSIFLDNALEASVNAEVPYLSFVYFREDATKIMIIENSTREEKINTKSIFNYGNSSKGKNRGIGLSNVKEILSYNSKVYLKTYSDNYIFRQELVFES
ncbi:GHKL domain-containing protein [Streptococcus cuniculipharyngis]